MLHSKRDQDAHENCIDGSLRQILVTCGNKERTVCFFPEKHLLINKNRGEYCELKRFKRSDTNDLFITDYTSVN